MNLHIASYCKINNCHVVVNGTEKVIQRSDNQPSTWLNDIYRTLAPAYPKFFKMDDLSKAGFLASEFLLQGQLSDRETPKNNIAIIFNNRSASLDNDIHYQATISDDNQYFPSPAVFVYTLANIVTGEIAIRNKIMGETSFFISENIDIQQIIQLTHNAFLDDAIDTVICGWVEYFQEQCDVLLLLVRKDNTKESNFNELTINKLIK